IQDLLAEHLAAIRQIVSAPMNNSNGTTSEHRNDPQLPQRIVAALQQLDVQHRYDGLVPLHALRPALPGVSRAAFDAALFDLERRYQVDLKIANDPVAVPHPEAGVRVDGRGLIYYVARR